jgi:hypothetical protein
MARAINSPPFRFHRDSTVLFLVATMLTALHVDDLLGSLMTCNAGAADFFLQPFSS